MFRAHTNASLMFNRALKRDPTRTQTLRESFARNMGRRYNLLSAKIRDAIVVKDVFGLNPPKNIFTAHADSGLKPGAFAFRTDPEKAAEFMNWVSKEVDEGVLDLIPGTARTVTGNPAWTDTYIQSAYKKGMQRADSEMRKAGLSVTQEAMQIDSAFNMPIHADRVGLLYTRTFEELKGAAGRLEQKLQRVLTEELALGIAEGRSPIDIARALSKEVGLERSYAKTLARTEIIRAHHVANINTYREAGVEGVVVQAEWATAGFQVCPDCADLQGRVFSLSEIESLIPLHPNCRCVALPFQTKTGDESAPFDESTIGDQYRDKKGVAKKRGLYAKKTSAKKPRRKT